MSLGRSWSLLVLTVALRLGSSPAAAAEPSAPFAITSISVEGTNLVLVASIPSGVEQVALQTRPTLAGPWQEAKQLTVETGADEEVFTIPEPSTPTAFFRLSASSKADTSPMVSEELQYVTMPSLGANLAENGDAIFHFTGQVDGSDKIVITRQGALWSHVNWDWPQGPVTVNGQQWNPRAKNYATTVGPIPFLPDSFSLESADLETVRGRDVIALERADHALIVCLDDTPSGSDTYEFNLHFHPTTANTEAPAAPVAATLKIAAQIDGSDLIKFTATEATWEHKTYSYPSAVTLNGVPWNPQLEAIRKNEGTNQFLPSGIDFSTAKIVHRRGRDLATMWADKNALWVRFADNPNGSDAYELEISFGR
jgi:hypothetical protein